MISENDKKFIAGVFATMAAGGFPKSVADYRAMIDRLEPFKNSPPLPEVGAYHAKVELRPGLFAAIAVPAGKGPFPVLVHCHGHGGIWGSSHSYRRFTLDVASAGYLAIMPDYRLGPEHKFPAGFEDAKFAVRWASENASRYGGDPSRIVLAGDSTGAGLAFSVALALRGEADAPPLKAVVGLEGIYDRASDVQGPMSFMLEAYLGSENLALAKDPRVSPIYGLASGALPSVLLITGSADFAAPGTFLFAQALAAAGLPYQLHVLDGMIHDFMKMPALDGMAEGHRLMFDYLRRQM